VKIPVTNTRRESTASIVKSLTSEGVKVNVTALMTVEQVKVVNDVLNPDVPSNVSIFAGRIADTGLDPISIMRNSLEVVQENKNCKIIWASPRELLNVFQANEIGCHIITATNDILKKLSLVGKDLEEYSLETVEMFYKDATAAGYSI
jgi:transaldolase